jgi:hypothetical protein
VSTAEQCCERQIDDLVLPRMVVPTASRSAVATCCGDTTLIADPCCLVLAALVVLPSAAADWLRCTH